MRNFLVEGVSGSGKTTVCHELARRGLHAVNGDTELAYQGDPITGAPTTGGSHEHHIWDVGRVEALLHDDRAAATFFCGGARNLARFIDRFDEVFVLEVDRATLESRLDARPDDEFGGRGAERALVLRLHETREGLPARATSIDATARLEQVVDEILRRAACSGSCEWGR